MDIYIEVLQLQFLFRKKLCPKSYIKITKKKTVLAEIISYTEKISLAHAIRFMRNVTSAQNSREGPGKYGKFTR